MRIEDPPIIRFGKHSGKSAAEVMAVDPGYVDWVMAQPWFQEKNPQLVQFFVGGKSETSETPEHNALQAKFTHDAYCLAAAAMFSAGQRLRTASEVQQEAESKAGPALVDRVTTSHPEISRRTFEMHSWDVQFRFNGACSDMDTSSEPECSCTPLPLPEVPERPEHPNSSSAEYEGPREEALEEYRRLYAAHQLAQQDLQDVLTINKNRKASRFHPTSSAYSWTEARALDEYANGTKHEAGCPKASTAYFTAWSLRQEDIVASRSVDFGLELKPTMGDDFPAVLRQVLGYLTRAAGDRRSNIHAAVVVGQFRSAAVPWPVVKQQFWESGVLLVREAELDALVETHAHEWGASLVDQDADFEVNFTSQL